MELKFLADKLPTVISRPAIAKFLPDVIAPKTLANLAAKGQGPRFIKCGRIALYKTSDLLAWLEKRSHPISTSEQSWDEDA